jgi:hypothetical protein
MVMVVGVPDVVAGFPKRVWLAIEGRSARTIDLKVGDDAAPDEGPANIKFAL